MFKINALPVIKSENEAGFSCSRRNEPFFYKAYLRRTVRCLDLKARTLCTVRDAE